MEKHADQIYIDKVLSVSDEHPLFPSLSKFAIEATECETKVRKAEQFIRRHIAGSTYREAISDSAFNTAGQINRAWPEMVNFLPDIMQVDIKSAQRGSRLPKGLVIDAEFNEDKQNATNMLAWGSLIDPDANRIRIWVTL